MADDNSKEYFDEAKRRKAVDWINKKIPSLRCECCRSNDWQLVPDLVVPMLYSRGISIGGTVYPQFMIVCKNCSNTKYFNAILSKVLPNDKSGEADEK